MAADWAPSSTVGVVPRRSLLAVFIVGSLALAGCRTGVATTLEVTASDHTEVTMTLTMRGEAARVLRERPTLARRLTSLIRRRVGRAEHTEQPGLARWVAHVQPRALAKLAPLTGIESARLTGESPTRLSVRVIDPFELRNAIEGVGDRAAIPVMLRGTDMSVEVQFPGGVKEAIWSPVDSSANHQVERTETSATLNWTLEDHLTGTFVVAGKPSAPHNRTAVLVGAAALLGMLVLVRSQRRR